MNFILDADIRSFFTEVSQQWDVRFLEHRIGDKRIIRLVREQRRNHRALTCPLFLDRHDSVFKNAGNVYQGGYDSVQRHVRAWRRERSQQQGAVFIP